MSWFAMRSRRRVKIALAIGIGLLVPAAALAAHTSHRATATHAVAHSSAAGPIKIIMIGGSLSDPFWAAQVKGAKEAAASFSKYGVSFDFLGPANYNNLGPDLARLEQTALARHPTIVLSGNFIPGAQTPGLKAIVRAKIPLIEYNTGATTWKSDGAMMFVGADNSLAGVTGGKAFASAGAKTVLCVNTIPGQPALEQRCAGIKAGERASGGTATELELPSTTFSDPSSITQAIKGELIKDPKIDGVVTIATNVTDDAWAAIQQASETGKVKLGTFDISVSNLNRIVAGQQLFALDQQPYLIGYYAASVAFMYAKWGLLPTDTWFKTGPILITKKNAAQALAGSKSGVRGAA
jgi:simple sugar transport system substrate-binding protein